VSGPPDPWGPPPWQPQPWAPPPWQPQPWAPPPWQPQPWRPLPPVVPARYDGPAPGADGGPPGRGPWVVVSVLAALVLVAGAVVALLLAGGGSRTEAAGPAPAASAAEPLLFGAGKRPVRLDSIPASPRLEPALGWDRSVIDGPDGAAATTALRFVQAVRAHDWPTAYGLCAAAVREAATTRARQLATTPPTVVGAAFYGDEVHGQAIADGALLAVEPYPSEYLVTFRLQLADASVATVTLWVSRQQAVQDWT
jgi:hypothetical protein